MDVKVAKLFNKRGMSVKTTTLSRGVIDDLKDQGATSGGCVLPYEKFRLFLDLGKDASPDPAVIKEQIIPTAERLLKEELRVPLATDYLKFTRTGERAGVRDKRGEMIIYLSLAESCEKRGRFTDKLIDAIWATMEHTSWVLSAHNSSANMVHKECPLPPYIGDDIQGIDLGSASTGAALAFALYFAKDALDSVTPAISDRLIKELRRRIIKPFIYNNCWWMGNAGNSVNNWNPWVTANVLTVTALTERDPVLREQVVSQAMTFIDRFVSFYGEDGACEEGPGYWGAAGGAYFDCLELIYDMTGGKIDIFDDPLVAKIGEYRAKVQIHDKYVVNFADAGCKAGVDGYLAYRFGKRTGSEVLMCFGASECKEGSRTYEHGHMYRSVKNVYMRRPEPMAAKVFKNVWFEDRKILVARESDDTGKGFFLAFRGGNNGESHNHNDLGSVIVFKNGEPVLVDIGVETYCKKTFSPQRYEIWTMQSSYHNLPDFGGVMQHDGRAYRSENEIYDPKTGGAKITLTHAYPAEAGLEEYTRAAVIDEGMIIITDKVSLKNPTDVTFHFITPRHPEKLSPTRLELAAGCVLSFKEGAEVEIERCSMTDNNLRRAWGQDYMMRINITYPAVMSDTFVFGLE